MNLPLLFSLIATWDYLLFVQYWPACWIQNGHIHGTNFTNDHFNVHGIWPEYLNGSYPEYCNNKTIFDVKQLAPISNDLRTYWTDYVNATAFWEHEFFRHGVCAESDPFISTELKFFSTGLNLRSKFDLYKILIKENIFPSDTAIYDINDIYKVIENSINKKVVITCENNILDEIIICLDPNLNPIDCPENIPKCQSSNVSYNKI